MTTAAGVVRLQAELLAEFMKPSPDHREVWLAATTGAGREFPVPLSRMGNAVDLVTYGRTADPERLFRQFGVGKRHGAIDAEITVQPLVALGLAEGRAFRVQENMTDAIVARADSLTTDTQFGIGEGQVSPPRASGFAWFEQSVPVFMRPTGSDVEPGMAAITWNTVVHADDDGPYGLTWIAVIWDDLARTPRWDPHMPKGWMSGYDSAVEGCRFVPVVAYVINLDSALPGTPIPPKQLGEARMRHPRHVIAALWQMLGETVPAQIGEHVQSVEHVEEETTRRDRRIAEQAGMINEPTVTTVVLRREHRPVQNPGTGHKPEYRVKIDKYEAWRWVGSERLGTRKRVRRTIREHWSCKDDTLPVRERTVVSELRR